MFDGTKSKFEAWIESIKNAVQISGQNAICISFSKLTGIPLLPASRLKTRSPKSTWMEIKKELSMLYSITLFDTHGMQASPM